MKKINVCFFLISGGWGGAENVVFHLAKTMEQQGHQINIILNEETYPYFKQLPHVTIYNVGPVFSIRNSLQKNFKITVPTMLVKNTKLSQIIKIILNPYITKLNYIKIKKKVLKIIDEIHPDIIHFHNPVVLDFCASLFPQIPHPTIYTSHGIDFERNNSLFYIYKQQKKRRTLMHFNKITAVSKFLKQYLISNGITKDIDIIYDGVDLNQINNIQKDAPKSNLNDNFKFIFSGGQKKQKGGEILLQAIKIVKNKNYNIKLFYCGFVSNDFMDKHQNKDVIFTGLLQHNDYLRLLSSCDCLTLLSETEGFSIAILEAMSLGKTIITTPVGAIPELVVNDVNACFVERNPQKLAKKINFLLDNPELRAYISKNNIQAAKKYNWENIVNQYIQTYKTIIPQDIDE
jgi:glycosyltransferase involved in cell wall biosynthesis